MSDTEATVSFDTAAFATANHPGPDTGLAAVLQRAWPLLLSLLMLTVGLGILQILVGVRATQAGFHEVTIGVLMSAYFVGYLIASRVVPNVIDGVGYFRTFAALAAAFAASTLVHPMVVDPVAWTVLRVIEGFCLAGVFVVTESWLNGHVTNATRGSVLGTYSVLVFGGMAIGQLFLNAAPTAGGFRLFSLVAILACLAVVPVSLSRQAPARERRHAAVPVSTVRRKAPLALVAAAGSGLGTGALLTLGAVYGVAAGLTVVQTSVMLAAALVAGVAALIPIGRLSDRTDRRVMIAATTAIAALAAIASALVEVPELATVLIVLVAVHGCFSFPQYSLALAHMHDRLDDDERDGAGGTIVMVQGAAAAVGPLLASLALAIGPPTSLFWYLAVVYLVVFAYAMYRVVSRTRPDQTPYEPVPPGATPVLVSETTEEGEHAPRCDVSDLEVAGGTLRVCRAGEQGTPVLIVHDLGSSTTAWEPCLLALALLDHVAFAYDLQGHGASTSARAYTIDLHVAGARALLEQVVGEPVHLVGHGAGATIAAQLALDHPSLARSLTLVSPDDALLGPPGWAASARTRLQDAVDHLAWRTRGRAGLARRLAAGAYDPSLRGEHHAFVEADVRRADPRGVLGTRRALRAASRRMSTGLTCPVLVVDPGHDHAGRTGEPARARRAQLPYEVRTVEGAGHFVGLDTPEELVSVIAEHIARVDREHSTPNPLGLSAARVPSAAS